MSLSIKAKLEDLGIDLDSFSAETRETFQESVGQVARAAQAEWIRLAQSRLKTSRADYINGLRQAESFSVRVMGATTIFEIALVGRMPNAFEFGMAGFDMKAVRPGWLGGSKAKTARDGHKYITIPFRHSVSSAANLAYTGKAARADLKGELKKVVRKYGMNRMIRAATGQPLEGSVKRLPRSAKTHSYLKGLTRVQQLTSQPNRAQGQLFTWRVMSEKSSPGSWRHPGLNAANLLNEVETWVDRELDGVIDLILRSGV
jgi:hypothetical protein